MTGICGLIGQSGNLESEAKILLSQMFRRGSESKIFSQALPESGKIVIGVCSRNQFPDLNQSSLAMALDGVFFEDDNKLRSKGTTGPERLIRTPGSFSFLINLQDHLVAGRDILGQKPLYYGPIRDGTQAFCSLRSPLLKIGVEEPRSVPPGELIRVSGNGKVETSDFSLQRQDEDPINEPEATEDLRRLFIEAVGKTLPRHSALAFSGGLDSGLVAKVARDEGLEPQLISVGLKGQPELEHSAQTARNLGLSINQWELSESEVIDELPNVVEIVETYDPTIVGISVPIYFACLKARELGLNYICAGQLSDELFGGYGRFEGMALSADKESLSNAMFSSVVAASANDFDPGDKLAVASGLELCCPFAYLPFVEYSLRIPASLKVRVEDGKVTRKYLLRKLAARLGLPSNVAERPKKAVQYSSGVQRVLVKEAKRRGVSLSKMLESFMT